MASGMARGAKARGKRIAFGDGQKIIWDKNSEIVFRGNPNIAPPAAVSDADLEWIAFYRGHRVYNTQGDGRWIWNYDFRPVPGEIYLTRQEQRFGELLGKGFVVIEPNVPAFKTVAANKQWPVERYDRVARVLTERGYRVVQFGYGPGHRCPSVRPANTGNFRLALAALSRAALYVGPEGGLHHGAAAVGVPAVVLFGGFVPPRVTGYPTHTNLTGGVQACGSFNPCQHCRDAMNAIAADEVIDACLAKLPPMTPPANRRPRARA